MLQFIILAGGEGERLWPVSQAQCPKPLLQFSEATLLQATMARCQHSAQHLGLESDIRIVANGALFQTLSPHVPTGQAQFIIEPAARNTAPAMALAVSQAAPEDVLVFLPADHVIPNLDGWTHSLTQALQLATDGALVLLGAPITRPETGYGYVMTQPTNKTKVERFIEKPPLAQAQALQANPQAFWNVGVFVGQAKTFQQAFAACDFPLHEPFEAQPAVSFDYAVMEAILKKAAPPVHVIALDSPWSDIGSWDSVYDLGQADANGNVFWDNTVLNHNTHNSMIFSQNSKRVIATVGLEDCLIIDTPEALLVVKRGQSQAVRQIAQQAQQAAQKQPEQTVAGLSPFAQRPTYTATTPATTTAILPSPAAAALHQPEPTGQA